jgi:hypothetical protein
MTSEREQRRIEAWARILAVSMGWLMGLITVVCIITELQPVLGTFFGLMTWCLYTRTDRVQANLKILLERDENRP